MDLQTLSNINIREYMHLPPSSTASQGSQPSTFNGFQNLEHFTNENLQHILQAANMELPATTNGDMSGGVDDVMENLYVIPPRPTTNSTPQWHSPEEPQPTGLTENENSFKISIGKPPELPPVPAAQGLVSEDDSEDEVIEVLNVEDCRLMKCDWNGKHAPSCKRFEISKRCGLGECSKRGLHQWYGFSTNKFMQEFCQKI